MKVNKIVKVYVVVFMLFLVSWNSVFAQEVVPVAGEENVEIGYVSNPNNLPECIVNVVRSIRIEEVPDLPTYSYLSVVDIHVPAQELNCHYEYKIEYKYLEAYRTNDSNLTGCSAFMKSVTCVGDILNKGVKYHLEFFTFGSFNFIPVEIVTDHTQGIYYWWIFIGRAQFIPIINT